MWANNIKRNVGTRCDKENIVIDLTGQTFGDWTVLEYVGNKKYLCECSCENHTRKIVRKANLINGSSTSCGHSRNSYGDLTGKQFGEWTVIRKKGYQWECRCSCAKSDDETHLIYARDIVSGRTKSCGHDYNKFEDISGNTYGLWHVLEYVGNQYYKCQCSCKDKTIRLVKKAYLINGKATSCGCDKKNSSVAENDILNYIKTLYNKDVKIRDRIVLQGKELDIYIPEKKLAIEFNGSYWHSELYKDRYYHQEKNNSMCKEGYQTNTHI